MKCCWIFKPQPQSKFAKMAKTIGWGVWYLWKEMGNWYGHTWWFRVCN